MLFLFVVTAFFILAKNLLLKAYIPYTLISSNMDLKFCAHVLNSCLTNNNYIQA